MSYALEQLTYQLSYLFDNFGDLSLLISKNVSNYSLYKDITETWHRGKLILRGCEAGHF